MKKIQIVTPNIEVSELKAHIGFWMRLVSNSISSAFAKKLEDCDVTVAEWVILRLMYNNKPVSPSWIAEFTGMTRGAISKLIDRLVNKNLVLKEDAINDRRYQEISLSNKAKTLIPKLARIADENDNEFFIHLSSKERLLLKNILIKVAKFNNLQEIPIK